MLDFIFKYNIVCECPENLKSNKDKNMDNRCNARGEYNG